MLHGKNLESLLTRQEKLPYEFLACFLVELIKFLKKHKHSVEESGARLGRRLCDDLFARYMGGVTTLSFLEACEIITRVALKLYFGFTIDNTTRTDTEEFSFLIPTAALREIGASDPLSALSFIVGFYTGILSTLDHVVSVGYKQETGYYSVSISLTQH